MQQMKGISLIEVQISFLLISISVVGIARLQMLSQKEIEHAYFVGQAYDLLEEMSRRIYLNSESSDGYQISELSDYSVYHCLPCSPDQMVKLDHSVISQTLSTIFPDSSASVFSCGNGLCMAIAWHGSNINACDDSETCIERQIW